MRLALRLASVACQLATVVCPLQGEPVPTMWHLALEAPPELFLDPTLLEEAGAHGMAGGVQI
jgi:hypothetical protein